MGKHVLDNFAVCCRNVATCVVNVASHYVVGKVGLQNYVLGVHVHLEKKYGERGAVTKEGSGEAIDTEVTERETDVKGQRSATKRQRWEE